MKKQKTILLTEPTLRTTVLVIKGGNKEQAYEAMRKAGIKKSRISDDVFYGDTAQGFFYDVLSDDHRKGHSFKVIYYDGQTDSDLIHEIIHLVFCAFDKAGIPTRRENDEIFAYHVGYWFDVITKEIKMAEIENV